MKQTEAKKRTIVLMLAMLGLCMQAAVYVYAWLEMYYPYLAMLGQVNFYKCDHFLLIAVYFVLLLFFEYSYGGFDIGILFSMVVFFLYILC